MWIEEKVTQLKDLALSCRKEKDKVGTSAYLSLVGDVETAMKVKGIDKPGFYSLVQKHINGIQECAERRGVMDPEEEYQLSILTNLMPIKMTEEEVSAEVKRIIEEVGASSMKDMGKVMSSFKDQYAGRYDGKTLSEIVKVSLK